MRSGGASAEVGEDGTGELGGGVARGVAAMDAGFSLRVLLVGFCLSDEDLLARSQAAFQSGSGLGSQLGIRELVERGRDRGVAWYVSDERGCLAGR